MPHAAKAVAGRAAALAAVVALCGAAGQPALAASTVPHEVVVKRFGQAPRVVRARDVPRAVDALRARPGVKYAVPNVRAHAAADFLPNDPGTGTRAGGWQDLQWNFAGPFGVGAPRAWGNAIAAGARGGAGVTVAVLDTGVAYANHKGFRRSPDLARGAFVPGYDFVAGDRHPFDRNGHGTHVASTIAERTGNGYGVTGLAYRARIMPVRVLDAAGGGDATRIAAGVRFAARHGAKVINLSLNFDPGVRPGQIPQVIAAVRYARRRGAVIVAATGNEGATSVAYPARDSRVIAVGATTENGCMATFSNHGTGVDLVAPGGGDDAALPGDGNCVAGRTGRAIDQVTLSSLHPARFGISLDYVGTSMATPHVSATAALVIATGAAGRHPSPRAVTARIEHSARDLGAAGYDTAYGWGLVDAGAATAPAP
jgi:serine protease